MNTGILKLMRPLFCLILICACTVASLGDPPTAPRVLHSANGAVLELSANPGDQISVEATSSLDSWTTISSFTFTNSLKTWLDVKSAPTPYRYYRTRLDTNNTPSFAPNFRLIDHTGKSRELYYYWGDTNTKAIVLVFTGTACPSVSNYVSSMNQLKTQFATRGVQFWMIDSKPGDTRSAIAAEATKMGITWPVFHDRAQSVARAYKASSTVEAVAISAKDFTIFYRGAIDGRIGSTTDSSTPLFLQEALTSFMAGNPVNVTVSEAAGCDLQLPAIAPVSYVNEIAPLLKSKCVSCHSPGNVAPWSMTNYAIVHAYADLIKEKVLSREMPPWHADPEYGSFTNNISLSIDQEQKLIAWIDQGARQDEGSDPLLEPLPVKSKWPVELGEPDLVLRTPVQTISATGVEPYRYIFVKSGLTSNVWLKAAIVRPSNPAVVHHYLVWPGEVAQQQATGIAGYVPGSEPLGFPTDSGVVLSQGTSVTFNLHYTPNGQDATDQPELALWFYKTKPSRTFDTLPLLTQSFAIPPGAQDYEVRSPTITLPIQVTLYRIAPHMHLRGSRMRFEAQYPNGTKEILLSVPNYSFHWQMSYQLTTPKLLPKGTQLTVIGAFDNSILNLENPDPTKTVYWGEQSFEEMFIGYFDFTY